MENVCNYEQLYFYDEHHEGRQHIHMSMSTLIESIDYFIIIASGGSFD